MSRDLHGDRSTSERYRLPERCRLPEPEGSARILVVDDDSRNLLAIEAALGRWATGLVKARSGSEAFRALLDQDFALVLLDVQLPGIDGMQVARLIRMRERNRHVPIIFITAHHRDDEKVLSAYELGAVDFLIKPIVPEVLRAKTSVLVSLQQRTAQVVQQAKQLQLHEREAHQRRLAEEKRRWEAEELRRRADQERQNAQAMARKAEELARTVADRERAEEELTRINQRKDEFLAMLAHELRNPLAPIVTGLDLLKRRPIEDGVARKACGAMSRQAAHLQRLVDDLLDVSRISSGRIELQETPFDLRDVAPEAIDICRPLAGCERISVDVAGHPIPVVGDRVRLVQVASNLLVNALRNTSDRDAIEITIGSEDDSAYLSVRDEGRGLEPELLEKSFELFYCRSHDSSPGLGVGLALVKRLVELHRGTVAAESAGLGRGCTFTVSLPLQAVSPDELEKETAPERASDASTPSLQIAVIEDNEDVRAMITELLRDLGHKVISASDGIEGLELLINNRPDLAIIDIGLPGMTGFQIAQRVREVLGDAPRLVAMTGYGQESDRKRAMEAGFQGHLVKPASYESLLETLQAASRPTRKRS